MNRSVFPPRLYPALLAFLAFLLCHAPAGHGQTPWKPWEKGGEGKTSAGTAEGIPATDEETDRRIEQIRSRLDELRLQMKPSVDNAAVTGMTPGEAAERKRLTLQRIYLLESREQALSGLKALRQEGRSPDPGRSAWKGFPGPPPHSLAALSNLYDQIYALRGDLATLEVQRDIREANLAAFLKAREASAAKLRRAEELLARSAGKEAAARARVQRDLALLRNEVDNEGALAEDALQTLAAEKIRARRKELHSLEEQYRAAESRSPLSREDLDRKLGEIGARREEREKELSAAIQEERSLKGELERTREALRQARLASPPEPSRIETLEVAEETERVRTETAISRIEILQGSLKVLNFEEGLWQDRYRFGRDEDLGTLLKKQSGVHKAVTQYTRWKEAFSRNLLLYGPLIQSESEKLRSGALAKREEASLRSLIAAYRERQALWARVLEGLGQVERVAARWKEDLDYRVAHASTASRARGAARSFLSVFGKIWNTELYVAEETTVIEGQKIVRPFSVTVGKVGKALIVLLAGLWVARRLREPVKRFAVRRFGLQESAAKQLEGKWSFFTFLLLLAFTLALLNIPLAVFAFFGGILAIGIGFGAQHLIGNLISSVILMFDRTISVGDIVEMEGQLGRVKSIGLRSSSILRFDGVEVVVPNSQFLEQKVTNWTVADRRVRYEIPVGVAYGTPTREAAERILGVVREDGRVLAAPEPVVIFEHFGDHALMFRVFLWLDLDPGRDNRIVCSDIRHRIKESLDRAGIAIPFPQRDVHLGAAGPIEVKVLPPGAAPEGRPPPSQ